MGPHLLPIMPTYPNLTSHIQKVPLPFYFFILPIYPWMTTISSSHLPSSLASSCRCHLAAGQPPTLLSLPLTLHSLLPCSPQLPSLVAVGRQQPLAALPLPHTLPAPLPLLVSSRSCSRSRSRCRCLLGPLWGAPAPSPHSFASYIVYIIHCISFSYVFGGVILEVGMR